MRSGHAIEAGFTLILHPGTTRRDTSGRCRDVREEIIRILPKKETGAVSLAVKFTLPEACFEQ